MRWVNASGGSVPGGAWVAWRGAGGGRGQEEGETGAVYVGRAGHAGGLYPGTLLPHRGLVHIPWGGDTQDKEEYQVTLPSHPKISLTVFLSSFP